MTLMTYEVARSGSVPLYRHVCGNVEAFTAPPSGATSCQECGYAPHDATDPDEWEPWEQLYLRRPVAPPMAWAGDHA